MFKSTFLLFVCLSLMVAGVANATIPACCFGNDVSQSNATAKADNSDMPCHQAQAGKSKASMAKCSGECMHVVFMDVRPEASLIRDKVSPQLISSFQQNKFLQLDEDIFQPPKQNS